MLSQIDQETLTEILKRLPVQLLVQVRCVCKYWYSLISSPSFISAHTKYSVENQRVSSKLLLRHYSWANKHEKYAIFDRGNEVRAGAGGFREFFFDCKSYSQYFEIVGSCNGMLCLSDTYRVNSHGIILWNPTIRKYVTLPTPRSTLDRIYMFVLGFGFDSRTNHYKVVRVVYPMKDHGCNEVITPKVEVYELGTGAWRSISVGNAVPNYVISELSLQAFLNGAVHWIGYKPNEAGDGDFRDLSLVLFDMGTEEFREMKLPDSVTKLSALDLSVGALGSGRLLSLVQYNRHARSPWIRYGSCCVWMMKKYGVTESWAKQFRLELEGGVAKGLGFRKNGEMLIVTSNGELVSYDLESQEVKHLGIKGIPNSFYLDAHYETLVLL